MTRFSTVLMELELWLWQSIRGNYNSPNSFNAPQSIKFPLPLGFTWVFLLLILSPELGCKTPRFYFQICHFFLIFSFFYEEKQNPFKGRSKSNTMKPPVLLWGPHKVLFCLFSCDLSSEKVMFCFCLLSSCPFQSVPVFWGGDCWEVTMSRLFRMTVPGEQGWDHVSSILSCPEPKD